jgi:hypothetical protein
LARRRSGSRKENRTIEPSSNVAEEASADLGLVRRRWRTWVPAGSTIARPSPDELLGVKPGTEKTPPKTARLHKRLQKVEELPAADQRTVLKLVDALHECRQRTSRPRSKARAAS